MRAHHYILRSVWHYRASYLGILLGIALGAMVLFGALFAGDSVRATLQRLAELRTGKATQIVTAGDRFFRAELADGLDDTSAPVLYLQGNASAPASQLVTGNVQLVGLDARFWEFAPQPTELALSEEEGEIAVNHVLSDRLGVTAGDTVILRLNRPGVLSGDAPIAGAEARLTSLRCTVAAVVSDAQFGRFSLQQTQIPQPAAFVPIALLQETIEQPGSANLVLINSEAHIEQKLADAITLADYGLQIVEVPDSDFLEVRTNRIFFSDVIAESLQAALPNLQPATTYMVNTFRNGDLTTPYSMASATTPHAAPFLPNNFKSDELVVNQWLADDLGLAPGDTIELSYYQVSGSSQLTENAATFTLRAIVPLEGLAADRTWMPAFPGVADAEDSRDWDPGLPLDLGRIRDKDETYWDDHRGTPKAFLPLAAGAELWGNRWGTYTNLRIKNIDANSLEEKMLAALEPQMGQLMVRNFRAEALGSAQSPVDFGGLFIGMSFFLIVAAISLTAMLFNFSLLQRNRESGLLAAVGIPGKRLLRWRLGEGLCLLLAGCLLGLPLAAGFTQLILRFIETIWSEGGTRFIFSATPGSLIGGAMGYVLLSLVALWLSVRGLNRRAASIRLQQGEEEATPTAATSKPLIVAGLSVIFALGALMASGSVLPAQGAFFLAGFLFLVAGLAVSRHQLGRMACTSAASLNLDTLSKLNSSRRPARSLTIVGLMATGVFMVLSVSSFRKTVGDNWREPTSGTGGYAFWVETTLPQARAENGGFDLFESEHLSQNSITPLRVGAGDDASCFNLNATSQPQLVTVDPAAFSEREAFEISGMIAGLEAEGWQALKHVTAEGAIPAFVDQTTLMWALKRQLGDVLTYQDEYGNAFEVVIAGTLKDSIFQGKLLVSEKLFLKKYPSNAGYGLFLIETQGDELDQLRGELARATLDAGGRVETTRERLAAFFEVENTYIAIFHLLGGLGVVLGSAGLAIVLARNLTERRREFAVLHAMGVGQQVAGTIVYREYRLLLLWGLGVGCAAAFVAVLPGLAGFPPLGALVLVGGLLIGIVANSWLWGWLAFRRTYGRVLELRESAES